MNPESFRYSKEHEWIHGEGDLRTLGITDHAQAELGDIVFVELPKEGDCLKAMQPFGTVESVKAVSELFSPVAGEVVEVNRDLEEHPERINEDPYGKGWILRIRVSDNIGIEPLMTEAEYLEYIQDSSH